MRCDQHELEALLADDTEVIDNVDCKGQHLVGLDFSDRHLRWVRFTGARLERCTFDRTTLECVFADFSVIGDSSFRDAYVFESVFAGARLTGCTFAGATADLCNFNAIQATDCDFSETSLRQSRFINARLTTVKFINCDVHHALFQFSERREVSFKHTNNDEAYF